MALLSFCVTVLLFGCGSHNGLSNSQTATATGSGNSTSGGSGASGGSGSGNDGGSGSGNNGGSGSGSGSGSSGSGSGSGSSGSSGSGSSGSGSSGSGSSGSSGSGSSGSGSSGSGSDSGSGSTSNAVTLSNVQSSSWNWQSWGQIGPDWSDCAAPCPESVWNEYYGVSNPSKSGNATEFQVTPNMPYADVLNTVSLIGQNAANTDADHTLLPSMHHFTYDADFYVDDPSVTSGLEFDISLWMDSNGGMTFGTQCSFLGEGDWDVWNNATAHWTDTGKPCKLQQGWNHVTLQFKRESDNSTTYEAIVINGTSYNLNWTLSPGNSPGGWWGLTANYQMDSDKNGDPMTTYVDNMNITMQP